MNPNSISAAIFYRTKYIHLEEAIYNTDDNQPSVDLVIIPLDPDIQTDPEDFDEDD